MTDFNATIRDHLTKQKARAVLPNGQSCVYRDEDGNKCAIGCLIPDELYTPEVEGMTVSNARSCYIDDTPRAALIRSVVPKQYHEAGIKWQRYHDTTTSAGFSGFEYSYSKWLEGDEAHSPAAFHDALIKYLADEAEVHNG